MPAFFLIASESAKGKGGIHGRKKIYVAIVGRIGGGLRYGVYILLYLPLVCQFSE